MSVEKIIVETRVAAPLEAVRQAWTTIDGIEQWSNASPDWHTPRAGTDLRESGRFRSRMEPKDGMTGFDFTGTRTPPQFTDQGCTA